MPRGPALHPNRDRLCSCALNAMDRIRENPTELLRIVNMAVGGFIVAGGIGQLIYHSFSSIILGIYMVVAGLAILGLEVRAPTEHQKELVHRYASFMHSFVGRGVVYVLLGVLMLNYAVILYISGTVVGVVGLAYIALEFFPLVEPPSTMQAPSNDIESQPVWQAPSE